ncbi:TPA: hypothetical protein ACS3J7_001432 [Klebsiella oxytoca]
MTTDITELALRLKLEAHRAVSNFNPQMNIKTRDLKELVEALEKAQAGEKQWREVVDAFCADDADWHNLTNSNNELIALLSQVLCKQADGIAELEFIRTSADKVLREFADELGCAGDNESILQAIEDLKVQSKTSLELRQAALADNADLKLELEIAEKRIAELESRTVKMPAERFCPAEYAGSQLWSETEVWNKAITACADALRAAGIKVEAE